MGTPVSRTDGNHRIDESSAAFQDFDDIYDDVMGPSYAGNVFANNEREIRDDETKGDDELFVSNEYSSVDEDTDITLNNDRDVYDDVGLPSEERVNSLYTGSTMGSILGSTWAYGKESEWEDLDDSTTTTGSARVPNKSSSS